MKITNFKWLFFIGLIAITLAYLPGLTAGFLLDDYATLPYLGQWGGVGNFDEFVEFVQSGFTGPTGRPVALVTFLWNGQDWPADPFPFLSFNLSIHIANTLLIFWFANRFFSLLMGSGAVWIAVVSSILWAGHPYLVSTVLYVVQRMVLLAVFFNILTLVAYLKARSFVAKGEVGRSLLFFLIAIGTAGLAIASKEMAIMIPVQVLLLEITLSTTGQTPLWQLRPSIRFLKVSYGKWLALAGIAIPVGVIVVYLIAPVYFELGHYLRTGQQGPSVREFNLLERVLTEQRVVGDFVKSFFLPPAQTAGVFWDGYRVSTSLLAPISTLFWLLFHSVVVGLSWVYRKKIPLVFFGIFWFYTGLILESSTVMLELKFEHRAYWPYWGLAIVLSSSLYSLKSSLLTKSLVASLLVVTFTTLLFARSSLWGKPEQAYPVWMSENPNSTRAIESAIVAFGATPSLQAVLPSLFDKALRHANNQSGIHLQAFTYRCVNETDITVHIESVVYQLTHGKRDWRVATLLGILLEQMQASNCNLDLVSFKRMTNAVLSNPEYRGTGVPVFIHSLSASAEFLYGSKSQAIEYFLSQDHSNIPLELIMRQSLMLANYGGLEAAAINLQSGLDNPFNSSGFLQRQALDMLGKIKKDLKGEKSL